MPSKRDRDEELTSGRVPSNLEIEKKGNPDSLTIHVWIILEATDYFDARRGAFVNSM